VGVLNYHGIRGSKLALDPEVSGLFGVSSPPSPEVALRDAQQTKFEKYSERVRSRPDIRFIPFAVTEFGTLGSNATAFSTASHAPASKGMHVGKLLVSYPSHLAKCEYLTLFFSYNGTCILAIFNDSFIVITAIQLYRHIFPRQYRVTSIFSSR
jgi:hypothetical protein